MNKHAVVIGSGFGGMAAALRARKLGFEVTLIERLEQLGGRARTFKRDGHTFDAGPTVITAPFLFEELFELFDRQLPEYAEILPVSPWYRYEFSDGSRMDYGGTVEDTVNEIERLSPRDVEGYKRLLAHSKRIFDVGFGELAHVPFNRLWFMLKQVPALVRLGCYRTVWQFTKRYLKDERLRRAFSIQPLLVGGNPFNTTSIYSLIHYLERRWGVHFPRGGTGALVAAMGRLMQEVGVNVRLNQEVQRICIEDGQVTGVQFANGDSVAADLVICNGDPAQIYRSLVPRVDRKRWTDRRIDALKYSMGLYVLYFGTTCQYQDVEHHTIVFGEQYQELLQRIFAGEPAGDDLSLYLHRPTATDPALAPDGKDTFYVLAPVPNLQHHDWLAARDQVRERVIDILEERVLPNLRQHMDVCFDLDPTQFDADYGSRWGAGFSIAPIFTQSAYFRFHNRSEDIKNLYLVGAGTHPGAGVPGVLSSAKVVEHLLKEDFPQPTGAML
ncbi:MAG TPA: phytoene desaturase [Gammaproteobacteria bacterium]|nr:phytoene desaturase [Gammaproteobacteria bacterium]|tara:strand:- start:840 stop:2336 length:1497 start_codon:yes stop_codon:yes gene_type:complete